MIDPDRCGHRGKFLEDPEFPLKRNQEGSGYVLVSVGPDAPRREFPVSFCLFCGERLDGTPVVVDQLGVICACIQNHADDAACPVQWDARLEEFNFIIGPAQHRIYFCPWSGTRLPKGRRSELFTVVSEADVNALEERLRGAGSIPDIIARLGEPDRVMPGHTPNPIQKRLYGMKPLLRQLDYLQLSPTARLVVQEYEDGSIQISYGGQPIPK